MCLVTEGSKLCCWITSWNTWQGSCLWPQIYTWTSELCWCGCHMQFEFTWSYKPWVCPLKSRLCHNKWRMSYYLVQHVQTEVELSTTEAEVTALSPKPNEKNQSKFHCWVFEENCSCIKVLKVPNWLWEQSTLEPRIIILGTFLWYKRWKHIYKYTYCRCSFKPLHQALFIHLYHLLIDC